MSFLPSDARPLTEAELASLLEARATARDADLRNLLAGRDPSRIPGFLYRWAGSEERPHAFLGLYGAIGGGDGAGFWCMVAALWSGFDAIPQRAFAAAFRRYRAAWTPAGMDAQDRAAFDALPPLVRIYRGQDADAPLGLAWTLRWEVAEEFAQGHRGIRHRRPAVLTAKVRRSSVAFMCTDRDEAEVVLFRPPARAAILGEPGD